MLFNDSDLAAIKAGNQQDEARAAEDTARAITRQWRAPREARPAVPEFTCPHCGGALLTDRDVLAHVTMHDLCAELGRRRRKYMQKPGGRKRTCECGVCNKCKMREWKRQQRAREKSENSS